MAEEKKENQEASPEEEEEEKCPECPPKGAPAWMATFADMATLLMAFFVLILSFAEFNVPKFKQISGSMKNAFGIQRVIPVVEQPKGTTILSLNFILWELFIFFLLTLILPDLRDFSINP